jgi:uncharacterized damage-inducible protein DinB
MEDLRYPIGKYDFQGEITRAIADQWIEEIASLPKRLWETASGLSEKQLDTPYRPGGWSVRQLIHHIGDSHLNSYVRFKWALTEDNPTIKAYDQEAWAKLPDSQKTTVEDSLAFIDILHKRWLLLLRSLSEKDLKKEYFHPESGSTTLGKTVGLYAWHGNHHLSHITSLRKRMNW